MKIGFLGLGKMGLPMVGRLLAAGHEVVILNKTTDAAALAKSQGATAVADLAEMANSMQPTIIWMMIPSDAVDQQLEALSKVLKPGSIIIDGGNSDFRHTLRRATSLTEAGFHFVDSGTSGGILGGENGYSLMVGGEEAIISQLTPLFTALAQPNGWRHVGTNASGHYVKMVHNAIEYGMMESYAEGYRMLQEGPIKNLNLASIGELWQHGSIISSLLNELTWKGLAENPTLEGIEGVVPESGEARWTLEVSKEVGIPLPSIQAAFDIRLESQKGTVSFATKILAMMRNKFGGHAIVPLPKKP